jgi:putative alpha-1,2-mannosidase
MKHIFSPHRFYSVLVDDYNIKVELTATNHCGMQRCKFAKKCELRKAAFYSWSLMSERSECLW